MIGRLIYFDERRIVTETTVIEENIFVDDGLFSASGLIENIAQTCAAHVGFVNKYIYGNDLQVGYIGAIRNMQLFRQPPVDATITTTMDIVEEVFGMTLAQVHVTCGEETLVTTTIKIAVKSDK